VSVDPGGGWAEVVGLPARSYRDIERTIIVPICSLLTLATGQRYSPSEIEVSPEEGTWWPIHSPSQVNENPPASQPLIRPSEISTQVIAHWLDRADTLGSLPAAVASLFGDSLPIETQVLILTTIAEGLHRALHPDRTRFTPEHGKDVQNVATAAVRKFDAGAADAVKGFLSHVHELGYGTRLMQLAASAEELVPGITGNTKRWKNIVYDTRNEYAHKPSTQWMSEADIDRILTVTQSLQWVLRLLFLDQAGLKSELLTASFRSSQRYRYFLKGVAEWQPGIYPGNQSG
jgi:hypothetical protein